MAGLTSKPSANRHTQNLEGPCQSRWVHAFLFRGGKNTCSAVPVIPQTDANPDRGRSHVASRGGDESGGDAWWGGWERGEGQGLYVSERARNVAETRLGCGARVSVQGASGI